MDKPGPFSATSPGDRPAVSEPVTLFAALSQHTKHLGFVATATTSFEEPYSIARKFASLDHISGGRAAWNLVTTQYVEDAKNFNTMFSARLASTPSAASVSNTRQGMGASLGSRLSPASSFKAASLRPPATPS